MLRREVRARTDVAGRAIVDELIEAPHSRLARSFHPWCKMSDNAVGTGVSTVAAVEIVTGGYRVMGNCRGLNERLRLIDQLNNPEVTHLQLMDVKVGQHLSSTEVIATEGPFFIDKVSVILGRSLASPEEEAVRNEAHRFDYVEKAKQRVLVFAPPFRIVGDIHVIKDAELTIVLPKLSEGFLAMTEALVMGEGENGLDWDSGFVVVNGRHVDMVCAAPPGYQEAHVSGAKPTDRAEGRAVDEAAAA